MTPSKTLKLKGEFKVKIRNIKGNMLKLSSKNYSATICETKYFNRRIKFSKIMTMSLVVLQNLRRQLF